MVPMAYCTHKPPCERQKGMISVVSRPTSINPISALLDQPPFNSPATMAIFTTASRAARISAATNPTRAQLAAITRMQEQIEPILRLQNQLAGVSAATEALIGWTNFTAASHRSAAGRPFYTLCHRRQTVPSLRQEYLRCADGGGNSASALVLGARASGCISRDRAR